jgi:hypothetical protein
MTEHVTSGLVMADSVACSFCAAKTPSSEGNICLPEKLGQSNKTNGKHRRFVFGRSHKSGTTMRPKDCPHPDHKVSTQSSVQSMLYKIVNRKS